MKATVLQSRLARKSGVKVQQVAEQVAALFHGAVDIEDCRESIRRCLDEALGGREYFVIVDEEGRGIIHTNRLREGMLFSDEVGQKAARATSLVLQLYPRNTGEWLIDAACPIGRIGGKRYVLRMGTIIHRPFLGPVVLGITFLPPILGFLAGTLSGLSAGGAGLVAGISLAAGLLGGGWLYQLIRRCLSEWHRMAREVSSGNLTHRIETKSRDQFHQMGLELNKMAIGVKAMLEEIAAAAGTTRDIGQVQVAKSKELLETFEELSGMMNEFRDGAGQQASASDEAISRIEEMLLMLGAMRQAVAQAEQLSRDAAESAAGGMNAVTASADQVAQAERTLADNVSQTRELAREADGIGEQVSAITSIARQTNTLALNASIEAARAGEHGKGFAVVANEVRKLAEETNVFAEQIMHTVRLIQARANEAAARAEANLEELNLAIGHVNEAGEAIRALAVAADANRQQAADNSERAERVLAHCRAIEQTLQQVAVIARQFTESVAATATAVDQQGVSVRTLVDHSGQLASQSQALERIVKRFRY